MHFKNFITLCCLFIGINLSIAQLQIDWIEVIEDQSAKGIHLYAINNGHCPVTVSMGFDKLTNLKADAKLPVLKVIPNDGEEYLIVTLTQKDKRKDTGYSYKFNYAIGNTINTVHDENHAYLLPYEKGIKGTVGQGYHGKFSHHNMKALDFNLKEGTGVLAARAGIVIAVKEDSNSGCKSRKCKSLANYILVYHEDGSFASYVHLKKNGSEVKAGDLVKAGQLIGYSGNTGWSSGPHLHFEVYIPEMTRRHSVETKFQISETEVDYLKEKKTYTSR